MKLQKILKFKSVDNYITVLHSLDLNEEDTMSALDEARIAVYAAFHKVAYCVSIVNTL